MKSLSQSGNKFGLSKR